MFCYSCGFQISFDGAIFCPNCGTRIDGKTLEAERAEEENLLAQMRRKNELIPEKIRKMVDAQIEMEFRSVRRQLGLCHGIWRREKELYAHYGYEWYTPAGLNPNIIFD